MTSTDVASVTNFPATDPREPIELEQVELAQKLDGVVIPVQIKFLWRVHNLLSEVNNQKENAKRCMHLFRGIYALLLHRGYDTSTLSDDFELFHGKISTHLDAVTERFFVLHNINPAEIGEMEQIVKEELAVLNAEQK